jgi:hypothetical protein
LCEFIDHINIGIVDSNNIKIKTMLMSFVGFDNVSTRRRSFNDTKIIRDGGKSLVKTTAMSKDR